MLVDDDTDACILFERALDKVNSTLVFSSVNDGDALMQSLRQAVPDMLFLDLTLPGMNGVEILRELRGNPKYCSIKIIVYSNSVRLSDIGACYTHGADLFIVKPFSQSHLVNALQNVLELEWNNNLPVQNRYFINNQFVPFTALSA